SVVGDGADDGGLGEREWGVVGGGVEVRGGAVEGVEDAGVGEGGGDLDRGGADVGVGEVCAGLAVDEDFGIEFEKGRGTGDGEPGVADDDGVRSEVGEGYAVKSIAGIGGVRDGGAHKLPLIGERGRAGGGDGKSCGCADGRVLGLRLGGDGGTYADVDGGIGAKGLPLRVGDDDVIEAGVGVLGAGDGQGGVGGAEDVSSVELPLVGQIVGETDLEIFPAKIIQHA